MKQLFLALTPLSQTNMAGGSSVGTSYVQGRGAGVSGFGNLLLLCCCIGGLYSCGLCKGPSQDMEGPGGYGGYPVGMQGGYAQPSQSSNPYWQGESAGTQLTQPERASSDGFMGTLAPNGRAWKDYCTAPPEISAGKVIGPWGECLAWAVVYEHQHKDWEDDPTYHATSGGPAGSVIDAMIRKAGPSMVQEVGKAADALEQACRDAVQANRALPVINQRV